MTRNTRNSRFDRRATEKARAITKSKAKKQNIIIATVAIALVAVISSGFIVFGAMNAQPKVANTAPTTVSAKADKAAQTTQKPAQTATQAAAQKSQSTAAQPAAAQKSQTSAAQPATAKATTQSTAQTTAQKNTQTTAQKATEAKSEDKIEKINGERVYIDTKRTAPEKTGTPAHYYANGKTSYGFDWDYSADNSNFTVSCNYNFDKQQYDFTFYGTKAGTSHVTLYYFTADNVKVPVSLTVTVDSNLNVSVG